MRVQKHEKKRMKPRGAHEFFDVKEPGLWNDLRSGKVVDIPDDIIKEILDFFGGALVKVKEKVIKRKAVEDSEDGK